MMGFIEKHLNDPFYLNGDMRISLRDKIFREAVSNIVSHRDYVSASPGRLMIYKDKVIFDNPCTRHHFGEITLENLRPYSHNPVICKFMIQLGRFDELGSGVRNINKYLPLYARGAKPVFTETRQLFSLTLPIVAVEAPVTPEAAPEVTPEVTPEVLKMLLVIKGQMTRMEIMERLKLKDEKHFREHYQQTGIKLGVIEMAIPDKPRSSKQKYRLTEKGRKIVDGIIES
jgi:ATP-dependent DNA helicase RecG